MTVPVEESWISPFPGRKNRKWLGFNSIAIAYLAAAADFIAILAASGAGYSIYEQFAFGILADPSLYVGIGLLVATIFVLAMGGAHAYRPSEILAFRRQILLVGAFLPSTLLFLLAVAFFLKISDTISRGAVLATAVISIAALMSLRAIWYRQLTRAMAQASFPTRRVLLICGESTPAGKIVEKAALSGLSIKNVMQISETAHAASGTAYQQHGIADVDEVLVAWNDYEHLGVLEACLRSLQQFCVPVSVMFGGLVGDVVDGLAHNVGEKRIFQTHRPPLDVYERVFKRIFDVLFSLGALSVMLPICVVVAIAIKLDSPGPIFFSQSRKGYSGRTFRILKFRSMSVMEDAADIRQATRGDSRITRVGAFIRSTSLDELPQFWNVLKGDMSVVGPRPHALAHDDLYDVQIARYASRRHVKPGLTGWAQVNGCRGETPTVDKMAERVRHDLWYINNWSLWLDMRIILLTVAGMQDRSNVY
ncbi:exopolysaccharide biosynthesis polyprenyl glycosylphosphotransferase [Rhizobium sp. S152]|uniref:exopolysaccharide biosynthesis polyprenyl glycosylphosphotransferase n=1 Tax=Rhizobium sp. S152 TaxID=3055038 RepID=UPI0025A98376|nr:exopolysaccharide biosynthesis polyprenyl glycosylphosphotransferase [Rhizobium sp. S152]MDM9624874.1 exopolysaccharide biosynthesis polyprenyl glycosylphosphotransferase [Rhizobium sp. S152]